MSRFTLLLGGELTPTPRVLAQIAGTRVIAADSGMRHAHDLYLTPELWVGDFDSSTLLMERAYPDVARRQFPAEKSQTDGELAAEIAVELGATMLTLVGAFGGARADHAFLHLTLALRLAERGIGVTLSSGAQEGVPLIVGDNVFDFADGTLFSIIGFTDLEGLTVRGAKWPLDRREVPFGSSLTISNAVAGRLSVSLASGRAMVIAHPFLPDGA